MPGRKMSWKEAEDRLSVCRLTIQKRAREALKKLHPTKGKRELRAIMETVGVFFSLFGNSLWMARRGGRYVIKSV